MKKKLILPCFDVLCLLDNSRSKRNYTCANDGTASLIPTSGGVATCSLRLTDVLKCVLDKET